MTSEYDELLAELDDKAFYGDRSSAEAAAAIRALTAQVLELTTERESILSASEQGEAGGIIKNAREDAAGWAEAAEPLQGREYFAYSGVALTLLKTAGVAERAILRAVKAEEQVVERDAVIEQMRAVATEMADDPEYPLELFWRTRIIDASIQAPSDALAARDAVRDQTVRATALRDAAGSVRPVVIRWEDHGGNIELMLEEWLHARADQEEL